MPSDSKLNYSKTNQQKKQKHLQQAKKKQLERSITGQGTKVFAAAAAAQSTHNKCSSSLP